MMNLTVPQQLVFGQSASLQVWPKMLIVRKSFQWGFFWSVLVFNKPVSGWNYPPLCKKSMLKVDKINARPLGLFEKVFPSNIISFANLAQCNYDLEGSQLYSVKWYKNGQEFFRWEIHWLLSSNVSNRAIELVIIYILIFFDLFKILIDDLYIY